MTDLLARMLAHAALHEQLTDDEQQQWGRDLREAADTIDSLRAQVAALEQDAKRYRWLRDKARSVDWTEAINGWSWTQHCRIGAQGMDAAIDAAMKG